MSTDEPTNAPAEEVDSQATIEEADSAAGYRSVVDDEETTELPADDPNVAASQGNHNHEDHVGEPVADDSGVSAVSPAADGTGES